MGLFRTKVSGSLTTTGATPATGILGPAVFDDQSTFAMSISGTFVGTAALQVSYDTGATWRTDSTYTAAGEYVVDCPSSVMQWRLYCTAFTSGSIDCVLMS